MLGRHLATRLSLRRASLVDFGSLLKSIEQNLLYLCLLLEYDALQNPYLKPGRSSVNDPTEYLFFPLHALFSDSTGYILVRKLNISYNTLPAQYLDNLQF